MNTRDIRTCEYIKLRIMNIKSPKVSKAKKTPKSKTQIGNDVNNKISKKKGHYKSKKLVRQISEEIQVDDININDVFPDKA